MIMLMAGSGRSRRKPAAPATWGGARLLDGLYRPLRWFKPVLALTITRDDGNQILVGVRTPESNKTHQNVASVPTQRVPVASAQRWLYLLRLNRSMQAAGRADLMNEISHIMSRKLGVGDLLESGALVPHVSRFSAAQGISAIGEDRDGRPLTESLTMFNAHISLTGPTEKVPPSTASYRPLAWASVKSFVAMTRTRDVSSLDANFDNVFFCAYGLCLETSVRTLVASGLTDGEA